MHVGILFKQRSPLFPGIRQEGKKREKRALLVGKLTLFNRLLNDVICVHRVNDMLCIVIILLT